MPVAERALHNNRSERIEARVSRETKTLCQRAARLQGRNLTDFVMHSAVEAAQRTVREYEFLELTQQDRVAFVEAVLNPPAPSNRLKEAAQRYERLFAK